MSQKDMKQLDDGFYWVRVYYSWEVAKWSQKDMTFYRHGSVSNWDISYFDEIDPRPIVREARK